MFELTTIEKQKTTEKPANTINIFSFSRLFLVGSEYVLAPKENWSCEAVLTWYNKQTGMNESRAKIIGFMGKPRKNSKSFYEQLSTGFTQKLVKPRIVDFD
jgi:hypothetical protein